MADSITFSCLLFFAQRPPDFPVGITLCDGIPLVVNLLAAAYAQLHFDPAVLQVQLQRNQRISLAHHLAVELPDFTAVQQQLLVAQRITVVDIPLLVRADVHAFHPDFALPDLGPAFLEVYLAEADAFDFCSEKSNAAGPSQGSIRMEWYS